MVPEETKVPGDRIDVGGHRGTVRYVGEVHGTKGTWLGVEWDDPNRGKHNGSYEGFSYFSTRYPTSGSFIRPAKVSATISCVDAVKRRYGLIEDNAGVDLNSLAEVQKDIHAKFLQFVGAEKINKKQSEFKSLQVISLRDMMITEVGPSGELGSVCPNVSELDLSKNLINSWKVISEIAQELPYLQLLNLSENLMTIQEDLILKDAFNSLRHLILAHNNLTWTQIEACCSSLPNLRILQVPFNDITWLAASQSFSLIESLDLEGNCLGSWNEVNKLGTLLHLSSVNVSSCQLVNIQFPHNPADAAITPLFPALQQLLVSDNFISDWESVSELDKLPLLKDLKFAKNPVLEKEGNETNYQLIIARIKRLKILNGQTISPEERRGAELDFLKRHGREYLALHSDDHLKFHQKYPCFQRFVQSFGPPEESELKDIPVSLKSCLIQIELVSCRDPSRVVKKKVSYNMNVNKLTGLVQRLFNTGQQVPRLFYQHSAAINTEVELDNELKDLNFFSVEDGSRIVVRW